MTQPIGAPAFGAMRPVAAKRLRYLAIAGFCAAAHNAIMIAGDHIGVGYLPMTFVSFACVTPVAYALHSRFTFAERISTTRLLRFTLGTAVGLPLSLLVMAILCTVLKLPVVVAAPIATVALFVWNYASAHLAILGRLRRR